MLRSANNNGIARILIWACWVMFSLNTTVWGQSPTFRPHHFKDVGELRATTVFQDSQGWIWFGAEDGLYRYDGQALTSLALPDTLNAAITSLFEHDGSLWAGFRNGAIGQIAVNHVIASSSDVVEKNTACLSRWVPKGQTARTAITAFVKDAAKGFWFSTYGDGVYASREGQLFHFTAEQDGLGSNEVYALALDGQGRIWAATDAGVSICTVNPAGQKMLRRLSVGAGLPDEVVTALSADREGNIWIGMHEKGVCRYNIHSETMDHHTPDWTFGAVRTMAVYGSHTLWIGTEKNGFICFDTRTKGLQTLSAGHPMRRSSVKAMYKDREGLLWSVVEQGSVYSANVRFGLLETPLSNVQSVLADRLGRLWTGGPEGVFLLENGQARQIKPPNLNGQLSNVLALWESPADGHIWAGTFDHGVFVFNPNGTLVRRFDTRNGLKDNNVLSISGDEERAFLATFGGVTVVSVRTGQCEQINGTGSGYVYCVYHDRGGRVWFGTDGSGLVCLDGGQMRQITDSLGRSFKTVYSIAEDVRGHIWFNAGKDGLLRFDGKHVRASGAEKFLHRRSGTALATDGNGQIIITYPDGLDLLNPARPGHVTFCGVDLGVPEVSANLNAITRDRLGNVWVGAKQGVLKVAVYDETFLDDPQPGITAVSVFAKPIDFPNISSFEHDQNYFLFSFTGLWYADPEAVRYRYRLEGFDPNWKVSKDPLASYPNLPPGSYVFRVQTSEHGNFDLVPEARWAFAVRPPFWTRWWFVMLVFALGGGLLYVWLNKREKDLKREAHSRREMLEAQFEALKSQINPHFLFNSFNTLTAIIEENPKIAVEYVEHLADFYRSILAYRDKDFIDIQEEKALLGNYDFLLRKRHEHGFQLLEKLNGLTGLIMPLALQMLVENAVKHNVLSASKPLRVEVYPEGDYVVVRNNLQPKLKPEPSTRFGLQSLVKRYQLVSKRPVVVENDGRFFTVKVPIVQPLP